MNKVKAADLRDHIGFWLRFVSNHVSYEFKRSLKAQGISVPEWVMLRELYDLQTSSVGALGELTGMTKGAISKVLDRLISKRLVICEEAEDDRRFKTLSLTEKAKRFVPQLAKIADENDEKFFSGISQTEKRELKRILEKIVITNNLTQLPTK